MGLDMYLFKVKREEVGYWRKANQIRNWLANRVEVENCTPVEISKEVLEELVADCKKVIENPELAPVIMPTSSGFFFGSLEYDDWYMQDLKDTVELGERLLKETKWDEESLEYYEWW